MKKILAGTFLTLLGASLSSAQTNTIKVAFIYTGPPGDYGWTYAHEQARLEINKVMTGIETVTVQNVAKTQAVAAIDGAIKNGARVVFTTSFDYMEQTVASAKKHPNVIFAHASGFKRAPNMATYMADFYQVMYLNGVMAGALTKTNQIAYIGAIPIPEVKRHINAYALGARTVNPKVQINVKWLGGFFEPQKAKLATNELHGLGNDIFAFTEDTPTVILTAAKRGALAFSHYSPMQQYAPKTVVSGQLMDWSKIYIDFLRKVQNGSYTNTNLDKVDYWWLLGQKSVALGGKVGEPINPLFIPALKAKKLGSSNAYELVMSLLAQMSREKPTFDPFTGPIQDRNGYLRITPGRNASIGELNSMQWAAVGVKGDWPDEPKGP
jgi:basic membrane protein A and related proteins